MRRSPRYEVVESTDSRLLIRDLGPWDRHLTITNGVEQVVEQLAPFLRGRRLEYVDSEGMLDEIKVKDGRFAGFWPART